MRVEKSCEGDETLRLRAGEGGGGGGVAASRVAGLCSHVSAGQEQTGPLQVRGKAPGVPEAIKAENARVILHALSWFFMA